MTILGRRVQVRKPKPHHIWFMAFAIGIGLVHAIIFRLLGSNLCLAGAISTASWLVVPCDDPWFGRGRQFYWQRQAAFLLGAIAAVLLAIL